MLAGLKRAKDTKRSAHTAVLAPQRFPTSLAQHLEPNPSFEEFCSAK